MSQFYIGKGELNKLGLIIQKCNSKRIMLVTGKGSYENSDFKEKIEKILTNKIYFRYSEFEQNPRYEDILLGIKKVQEFSPDLIIGIGGGSVLDTAKLLSVLSKEADVEDIIKRKIPAPERDLVLVLIPTTAGSGAECTHFAVLYLGDEKYSIGGKSLLPDYAIIDSELTYNVPKYITIATAFDALAQSIESYWSVASTEESRKYASKSIFSIMSIFDNLIVNPDKKSRDVMMLAAHLSGKAINITKTTAAHALSYGFTMKYNIVHGHAVMLTLPRFFIHNAHAGKEKINQKVSFLEHQKRMKELCSLLDVRNASEAESKLNLMIEKTGITRYLKCIGKDINQEILSLVDNVNLERLENNPVYVEKEELIEIVKNVLC